MTDITPEELRNLVGGKHPNDDPQTIALLRSADTIERQAVQLKGLQRDFASLVQTCAEKVFRIAELEAEAERSQDRLERQCEDLHKQVEENDALKRSLSRRNSRIAELEQQVAARTNERDHWHEWVQTMEVSNASLMQQVAALRADAESWRFVLQHLGGCRVRDKDGRTYLSIVFTTDLGDKDYECDGSEQTLLKAIDAARSNQER